MLKLYENIKRRRLELGLTQDELAKLTGYTDRSSIAKIEKGFVDLPQSKILLFAEVLNISPVQLMGLNDSDDFYIDKSPYIQELVSTASACDPEDIKLATDMLVRLAEYRNTIMKGQAEE